MESKFVVEGAMGAIAPDAESIFRYRGIHVLPDVYSLSGGLSASAYEWTQTKIHETCEAFCINCYSWYIGCVVIAVLWKISRWGPLPAPNFLDGSFALTLVSQSLHTSAV